MRYVKEPFRKARRVTVPGRTDIGEVIDEGRGIGVVNRFDCVVVHFPKTGEVCWYDRKRVTTVD